MYTSWYLLIHAPALSDAQAKKWYLKKHHFSFLTANMKADNYLLSQQLCQIAKTLWVSGNVLAVDESIFEYLGTCPVKKYIPRKPRPNGLQAISMCSWAVVDGEKMPVLLDVEPNCSVGHNPTPHVSFIRIVDRTKAVLPFPFPRTPTSLCSHCRICQPFQTSIL